MSLVRTSVSSLALLALLAASGCATTSSAPSGSSLDSTVRDIHGRVRLLGSSVNQLSETTAELGSRVNDNNEETRRLRSLLEENQVKLDDLAESLSQLTATAYAQWNRTPPQAGGPSPLDPFDEVLGAEAPSASIQPPPPLGGLAAAAPPAGAAPGVGVLPVIPGTTDIQFGDPTVFYQQALKTYVNSDYPAALGLFETFLKRFPNSDHVPNAQFFKGLCLFWQGEYDQAIREYQVVIDKFPTSPKLPSALQNQAAAHAQLGQVNKAQQLLLYLIDNYPISPAAEQAKKDLQKLRGN